MRMPRRMNTGFQSFNIGRMLAGTRVNSEMVDIHSHLDRTLNYGENLRNIQKQHGIQTRNFGLEQHQQRHQEQHQERVRRQDPDRMTGHIQNAHNREIDRMFQAQRPGRRRSAAGNRYYERRENHADRGKLL
jgi:hypothetical protein